MRVITDKKDIIMYIIGQILTNTNLNFGCHIVNISFLYKYFVLIGGLLAHKAHITKYLLISILYSHLPGKYLRNLGKIHFSAIFGQKTLDF